MSGEYRWLNPPADWSGDDTRLELRTDLKTDFWRRTFYGFTRDDGHAYLRDVSGDFTASVVFRGEYEHLYDQAGLLLRLDEANWIKAGIEFTDGIMHFSTVVTRDVSDWSVIPLPDVRPTDDVRMRLTRHGDAVRVQLSTADGSWQLARLAPFSGEDCEIGLMACSPERAGFHVLFRDLVVGPAIPRDLHAPSD